MIKIHTFVLRKTKGKRMSYFRGMPILLLNTIGRKSGKSRTIPLMYFQDAGNYIITASNGGSDRHPGWFYNLKEMPQTEIEAVEKKIKVTIKIASKEEKKALPFKALEL